MSRKRKYQPKSYESCSRSRNERFVQLQDSLLEHNSFKNLSAKQKILYVYMKDQRFVSANKPSKVDCNTYGWDTENTFYFNFDLSVKLGLYTAHGKKYFYQDIKELINAGFIEIRAHGKNQYQKNIYCLSDKWHKIRVLEKSPCSQNDTSKTVCSSQNDTSTPKIKKVQ